LASTLVFAQRGGGGGGRNGDSNMPRINYGGGNRIDRLSDSLKLSKDQKKDVKAAMDDAQKEAFPIHEQITQSHLAVAEAVAAGKSQEEVAKAVHAEAELDTQLISIELHAFAKVVSFLEPDQKQRGIPMVFAMVRGVFNGKNWNLDQ
jgi:Spy/CpxP family protein refolding chaperone